jgi:hypothetical protein
VARLLCESSELEEIELRFIRTDRGDYVASSAIERVEGEPFEKVAGKPDAGIRKFNFYNRKDESLGSIKVTEDRMNILLAELVSAQPGQKLITLHFDEERQSVYHFEYAIIAWAFEPGGETPSPITIDGNVYAQPGIAVLIEMPDGKLEEPYVAIHDSLEAAEADFLKQRTRQKAVRPVS